MPLEAVTSLVTFGSELLNIPRPIGSAVPSSRFLARRMASYLPRAPRGYVIELGAGTGGDYGGPAEARNPTRADHSGGTLGKHGAIIEAAVSVPEDCAW